MSPASSRDRDVIVVEHLEKSFPVGYGVGTWIKHRGAPPWKLALRDITMTVRRGELLGLLGPNGAGKTTLLKLLATLSIPDRGRVTIDGIDVAKNSMLAKRKIGLCPNEERSFYYRLTARANLHFFGTLAGLRGAELERRIDEVVELVDLRDSIDKRFEAYSSGMRQRLTVARALLGDPEVLLLDEPTRAVDPVHAESLRRFIRDDLVAKHGKTVVLATNLLDEAWRLCDRIAVLNGGRLVALGPPRSLDGRLRTVTRFQIVLDHVDDALLARTRAVSGLTYADVSQSDEGELLDVGLEVAEESLSELFRALTFNGAVLRSFKSIDPDPVDVFREVTTARDDRR